MMKGILIVSVEVFRLLPNHMNVKMYLILSTYHPILKNNCLRKNKFSCFLYWINIYRLIWVKPLLENMCIYQMQKSVWKDFQEHMKSSSKSASEKRRLTQYVTNTTLDDNFKGTTEQFVLHFNEQL